MSVITAHIRLLRPHQWIKNLMIFFPPVLAGLITTSANLYSGIYAFLTFSLLSSAIYIYNDLKDMDADKRHPKKRLRPLPSGTVSKSFAWFTLTILLVVSILCATLYITRLLPYLLVYLLISVLYSSVLKNVPVLELFCISSGFIIRLLSGGAVFDVNVSEWLFLSVFLLSIFLITGKRLGEIRLLGVSAGEHRKALLGYPEGFLDGIMYMTGGAVLVTYTIYTISRHSTLLVCTVPLCCFGLMRYLLLVQSGRGGDPTESLVKDVQLFIVGISWAVMVGWGIYGR